MHILFHNKIDRIVSTLHYIQFKNFRTIQAIKK